MPPEWLGVLQDHGWTFNDGKAYEFLTNRLGPAAASARSWVMSREEGILLLAVDNHCDNKPRWSHPDLTPKVWERAKATIYDGVPSLALSPEDEFLFLCWHIVTEWLKPEPARRSPDNPVASGTAKIGDTSVSAPRILGFLAWSSSYVIWWRLRASLPARRVALAFSGRPTIRQRTFRRLYGRSPRGAGDGRGTRVPGRYA